MLPGPASADTPDEQQSLLCRLASSTVPERVLELAYRVKCTYNEHAADCCRMKAELRRVRQRTEQQRRTCEALADAR
jgi:hypothetical protein